MRIFGKWGENGSPLSSYGSVVTLVLVEYYTVLSFRGSCTTKLSKRHDRWLRLKGVRSDSEYLKHSFYLFHIESTHKRTRTISTYMFNPNLILLKCSFLNLEITSMFFSIHFVCVLNIKYYYWLYQSENNRGEILLDVNGFILSLPERRNSTVQCWFSRTILKYCQAQHYFTFMTSSAKWVLYATVSNISGVWRLRRRLIKNQSENGQPVVDFKGISRHCQPVHT